RYTPTQEASGYPYASWAGAEYLTWWIKDGPKPPPLVTTGPIGAPHPGLPGAPGTAVVFGDADLDYGTFAGVRCQLGSWMDLNQKCGAEVTGLLLEKRAILFAAASGPGGAPVVARPFADALTGQETVSFAALPGLVAGGITASSGSRLWGL